MLVIIVALLEKKYANVVGKLLGVRLVGRAGT